MWKQIRNYPDYRIDENGNIISYKRNKETPLHPILTKYGYYEVDLYLKGKRRRFKVHRLVAETFIPNINNLPQINHKNGNKLDNTVKNIEWCTCKDNLKHARESGLNTSIPPPNGEGIRNSRSILNEEQILQIREKAAKGITHKIIALEYNIGESTVSGIVARIRWRHI